MPVTVSDVIRAHAKEAGDVLPNPENPRRCFRLGLFKLPWPGVGQLAHHDIHHAVLEVPPNLKGEIAVSALEVHEAPSTSIWLYCVGALLVGLIRWPGETYRLIRSSTRWRTVYHEQASLEELYSLPLTELRRRLGIPLRGLSNSFWNTMPRSST